MALRDYSNGQGPLSGLINNINDREDERHRAHEQHVHSMEQVGRAFVAATLIDKFLSSRRR